MSNIYSRVHKRNEFIIVNESCLVIFSITNDYLREQGVEGIARILFDQKGGVAIIEKNNFVYSIAEADKDVGFLSFASRFFAIYSLLAAFYLSVGC